MLHVLHTSQAEQEMSKYIGKLYGKLGYILFFFGKNVGHNIQKKVYAL